MIDGGTSALAKRSATLQNNRWSLTRSNRGRRCSTVISDALPAAPLLADRTFFRNFPVSRENGTRGLWLRISGGSGSRERGGRFVSSSISATCRAYLLPPPPPPMPVAQTTTRPTQPSSRSWQPVSPDRPLSTFPSCCSFLVALGTGLQQRVPLSSREHIKPFTEFLFRDQPTP